MPLFTLHPSLFNTHPSPFTLHGAELPQWKMVDEQKEPPQPLFFRPLYSGKGRIKERAANHEEARLLSRTSSTNLNL